MTKDGQIIKTLLLTLLLFIAIEVSLQLRSQLKFGNSIFKSAFAEEEAAAELFVQHDGYKALAPSIIFTGSSISVQSNALGLRSAEIAAKAEKTTRVVVLGASSTYGAYAATNADTFPARLQQNDAELSLDVINAGIPGNDIGSQYRLYQQLLSDVSEDVLILYSGLSNDIGRLCRNSAQKQSYALPQLQAPKWLLSVDLLLKNSTDIRYIPYKANAMPDLSPYLAQYASDVEQVIQLAQQRGVKTIFLAENLRAFRPQQPIALQQALADSALYYTPCLSVAQFSQVFEQYNQVLAEQAQKYANVRYVALSDKVPGGRQYFTDSVHFSARGEQAMADALLQELRAVQVAP